MNVGGVENVVAAAVEANVKRLVSTSSNNVTLDGPVIDGDETWPYAKNARDLYTETKILGEKTALAANGLGQLLACVIRPGGIYGPGESLVVPRLVEELGGGRYGATIGDGTALSAAKKKIIPVTELMRRDEEAIWLDPLPGTCNIVAMNPG